MTAGKYIIFYKANFRKDQLCRKLNIVFYSPQDVQDSMMRVSAKNFGTHFLDDLERRNFKRQCADGYKQPYF